MWLNMLQVFFQEILTSSFKIQIVMNDIIFTMVSSEGNLYEVMEHILIL